MNSPEGKREDVLSTESREVHLPRVAPSSSNSSGVETKSGSDGSCGSGETIDSSSGSTGSDSTSSGVGTKTGSDGSCGSGETIDSSSGSNGSDSISLEDEENDNSVGVANTDEAKIADVDFGDDHKSHRDDLDHLLIGGDHEDGEGNATGAATNTGVGQKKHKIGKQTDKAMENSNTKQASHLIRSVDIDAICLWNGVAQDEPVTDVRIVMVVDSKPDTHLALLKLDDRFVKTASFYSIQKLFCTMTETGLGSEEMLVPPRQISRSTDTSGGAWLHTRFCKQNDRKGSYPQRRRSNGEVNVQMNHDDNDEITIFKKRRLFPITRSTGSIYPVVEIDRELRHAYSEPTIHNQRGWPTGPAGAENPLWKSPEWIEKSGSLRKESRSTSGHTVHIHSRRTSSSRSSAPSESFPPRTAGQSSSKLGFAEQAPSHRHCEACKLGQHRLLPGSVSASQTIEAGSNIKLDSGGKNHQTVRPTCCQPFDQNGSLARGSKTHSEKQNGGVTKNHEPVRDEMNGHINTHKSFAPHTLRSRGPGRTEELSRDTSISDFDEKSLECVPVVAPPGEVARRSGYGSHMKPNSSSSAQNSFLGSMETKKVKNIGQSRKRMSSFGCAVQDKRNGPIKTQTSNPSRIPVRKQSQSSASSLSTDVSPKSQMRGEGASSADPAVQHVDIENHPIPMKKDGKLELYFANDIASGVYLIEIVASVCLSAPDFRGWRDFLIPGLLPSWDIDIPILVNFRVQSNPLLSPTEPGRSPFTKNPDCSWIAEAQFNSNFLFNVGIFTPTQIAGKIRLGSIVILQLRLKIPVYDLDYWNSSTFLRTFSGWSEGRGLQMKHHASLSMISPALDICAERVKYSFLIKNGFHDAAEYTLNLGECLIQAGDIDWQDTLSEHHGEVTVIRHVEDLGKPLEIFFTLSYPKKDQLTIRLPTLSPKTGNVMSERVLLVKPSPPLVFEYPERDSFSTWRRGDYSDEQPQGERFDRQNLPRLFPEGLKDDLVIKVSELAPVHFRALQCQGNPLISEPLSNIIWNLKINIDKVFGGGLECLMKFDIQVGYSDQMLTIDPHDWTPDLFIIKRRLATQAVGEWRKDRHGNLVLFRLPDMAVGDTIEIALRWYKLIVRERLRSDDHEQSAIQHSLPKIMSKSILGGSLRCNVDSAIHISSNGKLRDAPWQFSNNSFEKQIRLPKLYLGYTVGLSLTGVPYRPARSIRFKDEQPKPACTSPMKHENIESRSDKPAATDQLTPVCIPHPDRESSSTLNTRRREMILSWAAYSCKLILRLLRCAFPPFLLLCAFHFALSRIMHARRPVDPMGFSSVNARHDSLSGIWSVVNLGSLAMPWSRLESEDQLGLSVAGSETKEPSSRSTIEHSPGPEKLGGAENETPIESSEDPGHGEPTAEGMAVMDWIDRALGWKSITH